MTRRQRIKHAIEALCDMRPGETWTEWHWLAALQLNQELFPRDFAKPHIYKRNIIVPYERARRSLKKHAAA